MSSASGFLAISDLLRDFPDPQHSPIRDIARRFQVSYPTASKARALAIDYLEVRRIMALWRVSQPEAEAFLAEQRKPMTRDGRKAGTEERWWCNLPFRVTSQG